MRRTWRRSGLPAGVGLLAFAVYSVAALLVATFCVWGDNAARRVDELVTVPCIVFAAACAGNAARRALGRRRLGWLALVAGLLGWAVGELMWAAVDARPELHHTNDPASAETVLALYPVGAMASLVVLSKLTRRSPRGRLLLDGVIVWTSLLVVSWVFVLDKQLGGDGSFQPATPIHIFADVLLLTTGILMLSRVRPGDPLSRSLLAGGVSAIAGADIATVFQTGIGGYHAGGLADLGRVIGLGMLALAALNSTNEPPTTASQDPISSITYRSRLWLPYLPLVLAAAAAVGHAVGQMQHGPMAIALGILVGAVLIRQLVVLVENQRLLSDVAREAFTDSLTGLANRAHFLHRLAEAVDRRDSSAQPIAVLCLDLDNFKAVNDALGHPAGDELLIRVAGRLTASLDKTATVARLGGDEFAVLIEDSIEVSQLAAHRILDAFRAAIVIDGVPLTVRPSIGFTLATAASSCTVDDLLRHADLAMYAAKRDGGQCVRSFLVELPFPSVLPMLTESEAVSPGALVGRVAPEHGFRPLPEVATATRDGLNELPNGIRWPPLAIRIALAALAIGVAAFTASSFFDPNAGRNIFLADILYPALNLSAAALIGLRAYRVSVHRLPWSLIATAMACSAMGDVIYAAWVPDGQSPSAADPAYIAFYPFAYAGLLLLMQARLKRVPVSIRLDSVVCGLTIGAVAAALTAGPIHAEAARAPATVLVGLIYPWGDLVLLTLTAGMLPIILWRNDLRWVLLVTGFTLFAAADTGYLFETAARSYRVGTLLDAAWPVASILVVMASWAPWSAVTPPFKRGLGSYGAPVACTIVALAVAVLGHDSRLATTLAALSLIAVAARFSVTFRDISMLAERHQNAMTDELTVLPNRRSLATALTAASAATLSGPRSTNGASSRRALLLLNLCDFQQLSNSIGRQFGDELLCRIANRLSESVRREDLLARVGDNEFAILLAEGSGRI